MATFLTKLLTRVIVCSLCNMYASKFSYFPFGFDDIISDSDFARHWSCCFAFFLFKKMIFVYKTRIFVF